MLNENIKRLRTEKGWSQEEFGKMVDVSRSYVAQIERNDEYNPAIEFVARMADIFGVSIDYLYRGEEYSSTDSLMQKVNDIEEQLNEVKKLIPTT